MLAASAVSRATRSQDEIARKDIRVGDQVIVQRAGDVIPQVVGVVDPDRTGRGPAYRIPTVCPVCGSHVERIDGEVAARCAGGLICGAQIVERLRHFVSRMAFDIDGLGERNIEAFFKDGLVKSPAAVSASRSAVTTCLEREGWPELSVDNLLRAIDTRRRIAHWRDLSALGIRRSARRQQSCWRGIYRHWKLGVAPWKSLPMATVWPIRILRQCPDRPILYGCSLPKREGQQSIATTLRWASANQSPAVYNSSFAFRRSYSSSSISPRA